MSRSALTVVTLSLASVVLGAAGPAGPPDTASPAGSRSLTPVATLVEQARARVGTQARVPLADAAVIGDALRLGGADTPNYVRALGELPQAVEPMAKLVQAFLYKGTLPTELKAAMGLRIAQINGSPYVAAHTLRVLRGSADGDRLSAGLSKGAIDALQPREQAGAETHRGADARRERRQPRGVRRDARRLQ